MIFKIFKRLMGWEKPEDFKITLSNDDYIEDAKSRDDVVIDTQPRQVEELQSIVDNRLEEIAEKNKKKPKKASTSVKSKAKPKTKAAKKKTSK